MCQRCGDPVALVGSRDVGVQIFKCHGCGIMDRRLPTNRRELELAKTVGTFWPEWGAPFAIGALGVVVAVVLAMVVLFVWTVLSGLGS